MKMNRYSLKTTIQSFATLLCALTASVSNAQTFTETFETFTLASNSAYSSTTSAPFTSNHASFEHEWDTTFDFWAGGFAYTNKYDSITGSFSNLYGVRAYKGYNNSAIYVVGQDEGIVRMTVPQTTVGGFYVTNTTYAYKAMAKGDAFSRKFGDTTGTGSGTTIPQGSYPDFFKLIVKGYSNGVLKNDSITVMLADYTFTNNTQDFILDSWQFVNTSSIGAVDSIQFFMRSSDVGDFGVNTPLFFAIDNFETTVPNPTGLLQQSEQIQVSVFPNPFSGELRIQSKEKQLNLKMYDVSGSLVREGQVPGSAVLDFGSLNAGVYVLELSSPSAKISKRVVKN